MITYLLGAIMLKIDLADISPEDIKESTETLKKVLQKEISSAVHGGVSEGMTKVAEMASKKLSRSLKESLVEAFEKAAITSKLKKAFKDADIARIFKQGIQEGMKTLKDGIKDSFKDIKPLKVDTTPLERPKKDDFQASMRESILPLIEALKSREAKGVEIRSEDKDLDADKPKDKKKGFDVTDKGKSADEFIEKMKNFGVSSEKIGDIINTLEPNEDFPEVTKNTAKEMENLIDQIKALQEEFAQYEDLLEKAQRQGLKREDVLSKGEMEHVKFTEASLQSKKADMLRLGAGKDPTTSAAAESAAPSGKMMGMFTKMLGGPLKMALAFFAGDLLGQLTKSIKTAVFDFNRRAQGGLQSAGQVVSGQTLAQSPNMAIETFRALKTELENSPLLKLYGGEQAFANMMDLQRATGQVGAEQMMNPEQRTQKLLEDMEQLGAKALMSGQSLEEFSKAVKEGVQVFGLNQKASEAFVAEVSKWEKKMKMDTGALMNHVRAANGSLRMWGHSLQESMGIAKRWGKAIDQGRIAMSDIIDFAQALHKQGEGESVFMTQMLAKMEGQAGDIAKAIMEQSGGDPMAMRTLIRRAAEGDKGISGQLGLDMKDYDVRRLFRTGQFRAVRGMSEQMAGGNENAQMEIMRKMMDTMMGTNTQGMSTRNLNQLMGAYVEGTGVFGGLGAKKPEERKTEADKLAAGIRDAMKEQVGVIDNAKFTVTKAVITAGDWIMDKLTGRTAKSDLERIKYAGQDIRTGNLERAGKYLENISKGEETRETLIKEFSKIPIEEFNKFAQQGKGKELVKALRPIIITLNKEDAEEVIKNIEAGRLSDSDVKKWNRAGERQSEARTERKLEMIKMVKTGF